MKRLIASFLTVCLMGWNMLPVMAMGKSAIRDVSAGYWAESSIETVVADNIMATDEDGNFNPDSSMTRAEFVSALLKVLNDDTCEVVPSNKYSDVKSGDYCYNDIMRSDSLGLVYGYPDGTFKPNQEMLRSECTSVISHITKDKVSDLSVLNQFKDKDELPAWSKDEYAKAISYGIFVNHPDELMLEPNRALTRAEGAVILAQLKAKLTCVKPQYVGEKENVLGTEHLSVVPEAPNNKITITNLRKVIQKDNVIIVAFDEKFYSKKHKAGEVINFVLPEALYTDEGTMLLPNGTKVVAEITRIVPPKKLNKNAQVHMVFKSIVLPDGRCVDMYGKPFTKGRFLKESKWMNFWNLFGWTVGIGAVGAGAGTGFAFIPNPAKLGVGFAIGIPVGCTVGLVVGLLTPGLNYKAKKGEQVMVILLDDASIMNK